MPAAYAASVRDAPSSASASASAGIRQTAAAMRVLRAVQGSPTESESFLVMLIGNAMMNSANRGRPQRITA